MDYIFVGIDLFHSALGWRGPMAISAGLILCRDFFCSRLGVISGGRVKKTEGWSRGFVGKQGENVAAMFKIANTLIKTNLAKKPAVMGIVRAHNLLSDKKTTQQRCVVSGG